MQSQLCAVHYTWSTSLPISLGRRPVFFFDISPSSSKKKSSATLCFPPSHRQLIKLAFQKERCRRGELNSIFHLAFLFFLFCRASGANGITREKVYGDGRRSSPRRGRNGPIGSLLSPVIDLFPPPNFIMDWKETKLTLRTASLSQFLFVNRRRGGRRRVVASLDLCATHTHCVTRLPLLRNCRPESNCRAAAASFFFPIQQPFLLLLLLLPVCHFSFFC